MKNSVPGPCAPVPTAGRNARQAIRMTTRSPSACFSSYPTVEAALHRAPSHSVAVERLFKSLRDAVGRFHN